MIFPKQFMALKLKKTAFYEKSKNLDAILVLRIVQGIALAVDIFRYQIWILHKISP